MRLSFRRRTRGSRENGMALMLAIIVLFVLTVLGLTLLLSTTTSLQITGAETTVNKTFFAADSGVQYAIAQGKQASYSGPGCGASYPNYWCVSMPSLAAGSASSTIAVRASPYRLVDFQLDPGNQLNVGGTPLYDLGYHFDSYAQDTRTNSQKHIAVDLSLGPVPFSTENASK